MKIITDVADHELNSYFQRLGISGYLTSEGRCTIGPGLENALDVRSLSPVGE